MKRNEMPMPEELQVMLCQMQEYNRAIEFAIKYPMRLRKIKVLIERKGALLARFWREVGAVLGPGTGTRSWGTDESDGLIIYREDKDAE
jgi:hypothetical protein